MPTNLGLKDDLVAEAQRIGGHRSKREAVNAALQEYIDRRKQQKILDLMHAADWDETYDHKAQRKKR
jgi:Arc/MetJ family transcription regulator